MKGSGMESYIVRVYRRDGIDPNAVAGMVEIVQTGELKKFAGSDELCGVICQIPKKKQRKIKHI